MSLVVYVDIVFLTNFVLDFAMLLAAAKARGIKPALWRVGAASAIGASYVLFMFVPALSVFYTFVVKCLFSAVMIMTAFGYKSFSRFLGALAAFYAVNAAAAGAIVGVHYMLQSSNEVWSGILFTQTGAYRYALGVSLWFVVVVGAAGALLFRRVNAGAKRKEKKAEFLVEVIVRLGDASYRCEGLIDTGNHLYDPLTRTPVMVMEASVWQGAFPEAWLQAIRSHEADRIVQLLDDAEERGDAAAGAEPGAAEAFPWRERIRLVPYRGINGSTRFMLALKPDEVTIIQAGQASKVQKVFIGVEGGTLSADGAYRAIVHPAMVP
ncbi:MAG TPA: sigma-E processing peptidase SpoIIGA [Paenibacillus sp.]|nr:sigma-E processing peptidase SpoIIGA [Paenibacillus sp.]